MKKKQKTLLIIDGIVNLLLGMLLLLFPFGIAELLGVPVSELNFYPTILGAVIVGIGVALLVEVYGAPRGMRGLGLGGAIAINMCGATALMVWLIVKPLDIPMRGYIILWGIGIIVLLIGFVELFTKSWKNE
jgi:hypothetical protein